MTLAVVSLITKDYQSREERVVEAQIGGRRAFVIFFKLIPKLMG